MKLKRKYQMPPNTTIKYFVVTDGLGRNWVRSYRVCFKPANTLAGPCDTRGQAEREAMAAGHELQGING